MTRTAGTLLVIDVAHPPKRPADVERELEDALAAVRRSSSHRILKIVHGYGSSGRGGSTRDVVRNLLYRHRSRLKGVVEGDSYGPLDPTTADMRREVGLYPDPDLDRQNSGITIVWVR